MSDETPRWVKSIRCPASDFGLPPCEELIVTYGYSTHEPASDDDEDDGFYRSCNCLEALQDARYDDYYQRILDALPAARWEAVHPPVTEPGPAQPHHP
jgi:hypothetical protein